LPPRTPSQPPAARRPKPSACVECTSDRAPTGPHHLVWSPPPPAICW
jgi:hypothetical protein